MTDTRALVFIVNVGVLGCVALGKLGVIPVTPVLAVGLLSVAVASLLWIAARAVPNGLLPN